MRFQIDLLILVGGNLTYYRSLASAVFLYFISRLFHPK